MALRKARQEELDAMDKSFGPGDFAKLMKTKKSGFGSNPEKVAAIGKALAEAAIDTLSMIAAITEEELKEALAEEKMVLKKMEAT